MQEAQITLSRKTLERLEDDYSILYGDEARQVKEALKAMRRNDKYEPLKPVYRKTGGLKMVD